jgi:glutamate---cysteine ligase / carboxylate-amine ligase
VSWVPGEHRFGCGPAFSVGIEEELLLVDPEHLCLRADSDRVFAALGENAAVKAEIFEAVIELISPPCRTAAAATEALSALRGSVSATGAAMIASGTHPDGRFGDAPLHDTPRYHAVEDALRGVLRTPTCALHVHVGMPDPEVAIRVANAMRVHVPMINALAANSPFWHGIDSGLASARTAILRSYPRSEMPAEFGGWPEFCETATELALAAKVEDYTYFWWDVRPHPLLGTVEVRCADVQCTPERTAGLAALIQSLARLESAEDGCVIPRREALAEFAFGANRYGLCADVPDRFGRVVTARSAAVTALALVAPYARELGCEEALDAVEMIVREGNGADLQRAIFESSGMAGLLSDLNHRTHDGVRTDWAPA